MALHEVQLKGYSVRPGNLSLGTFDSYGIEQLHVTLDDTWSGLAVTATFNPPKGEPVEIRVPENGLIDVPAEATANEGTGSIVYCGVANGVQLITKTQGYNVITHGNVGGTEPFNPSESLATQVLQAALNAEKNSAEANTAAQSAQTAAENATAAAQASAESASKAAAEAAAAKPYAESAKANAAAARNSENQAQQSSIEATAAKNAAQNAQAGAESSATAAAKSAKEAAASAVNLDSAANTATQKAVAASASAAAAKASESAAASSEAAARKYANSAESAAKTAGEAATAAVNAKTAAESAQADAAASKAAAANSATQANQSANAAANSATAAKTSEDAAAKSAADADSTANSINDSMTQIAANKEAVSQLKEDTAALQKRQNVLVGSETGNPVSCDDAFAAPLCGLNVYGKSTQDGTPTPDAPVPIVSAGDGGTISVKMTGKNLVDVDTVFAMTGEALTISNGHIKGTANNNGARIGYLLQNAPAAQYIASVAGGAKDVSTEIRVYIWKDGKFGNLVVQKTYQYQGGKAMTIAFGADGKSDYAVWFRPNAAVDFDFYNVQLELGSIATTYSPYREQLLTLSTPTGLPGIPVTSGGNYTDPTGQQWICDEVDFERGVMVQRVKVKELSPLDRWTYAKTASGNNNFQTRIYDGDIAKSNVRSICNILPFKNVSWNDNIQNLPKIYANDKEITASFPPSSEFSSLEVFKQLLTNVKSVIYYLLATPIETPLTSAELAAYKALTAYAPNTVVQASDGAGIRLGYQRDVNLVVKNLEVAIASMTTT